MITFFVGKIDDVFVSDYTKKDSGEVVRSFEVTATFTKRSPNGKLYKFTEHFRFNPETVGDVFDDWPDKFILVPYELRSSKNGFYLQQVYDLGFEVLDTNPFEVSKPEPKIGKKAS